MNNDEHRPHKDEVNDSTADRADGRDSPESTTPQKTDSRDNASHTQRTQLGTGSSTQTDATASDNIVRACPECDTTAVEARSTDKLRGRPADKHYACRHCGATFDEPVQRDRQATPGDPGYLAGKLAKADPDDVSADHAGEPMTDGGFTDADTRAQRRRGRQHSLPEGLACIEDPTGVLLVPTADISLTRFANVTVATPQGSEWIKSNVVLDREAWC